MLPILHIGPLAIQTPGLVLLLGIWLGLIANERFGSAEKSFVDQVNNLVLISLVSGVIAARLGYIAAYPRIFFENPTSLLSLNPGLLDLWSGVAGSIIATLIYGRWKKLPFWQTLDFLTPGFAVFIVALSLADLAAGNGYGKPANLPWAIFLWGEYRHPVQLYETLAGMTIFLVVIKVNLSKDAPAGIRFLIFVVLLSVAHVFLDAYRGDSMLNYAGIRTSQIIYWIALAVGLWILGSKLKAINDPEFVDP